MTITLVDHHALAKTMTDPPVAPAARRAQRCGARSRLALPVLMTLICCATAPACDDTMLRLLTASDPDSHFSVSLRAFASRLSDLGSALESARVVAPPFFSRLDEVLAAWVELDSRYSINPPLPAQGDPDWGAKMKAIAIGLGQVRREMHAQQPAAAHATVLAVFGQLARLFDAVQVSAETRAFLGISQALNEFARCRTLDDRPGMAAALDQVAGRLRDLPVTVPATAALSRDLALATIGSITQMLAGAGDTAGSTTADPEAHRRHVAIGELQNQLEKRCESFRAEVLMHAWFGGGPTRPTATATAEAGDPPSGHPTPATEPAAPPSADAGAAARVIDPAVASSPPASASGAGGTMTVPDR